ncbi:MAG: hypothetical protein NZ578_02165 [Candidatus Binatia bacterium]|nr:hypothetical protein [Candidatus Binatia bacterium]
MARGLLTWGAAVASGTAVRRQAEVGDRMARGSKYGILHDQNLLAVLLFSLSPADHPYGEQTPCVAALRNGGLWRAGVLASPLVWAGGLAPPSLHLSACRTTGDPVRW